MWAKVLGKTAPSEKEREGQWPWRTGGRVSHHTGVGQGWHHRLYRPRPGSGQLTEGSQSSERGSHVMNI